MVQDQGWGYIVGNYVTCGGVHVKGGDQYQSGRESLIVFIGISSMWQEPKRLCSRTVRQGRKEEGEGRLIFMSAC